MKMLHLDFDDLKNPSGGGQAVRTFEINRRLAKKHEITVITGNYPGAKDEIVEGIQYLRVGQGKFPWDILSFLVSLSGMVRRIDHDLLVENFHPPIGPSFTPLFTRKPVIAMIDWCFAREMSRKYKLPFFIGERVGLKIYQNFIFPTKAIQKQVLGTRPKNRRFVILPNLPLSDFKSFSFRTTCLPARQVRTPPYILFLGRLDIHQKGIDLLLRAYQKIAHNLSAPLYFGGEGREKEKIRHLIRKLGLSRQVRLLGHVKGQEKIELVKKARIVCLPSRYESGSVTATEYLLMKKPIVAFDIPVLKETTQNQAIFARLFDINDLAKKTLYAYQNADKISCNIKFKPLPTWDEVARKQEEFYLKVIASSTPR